MLPLPAMQRSALRSSVVEAMVPSVGSPQPTMANRASIPMSVRMEMSFLVVKPSDWIPLSRDEALASRFRLKR